MRYRGWVGVELHSTWYERGSGMFPLCEGCWAELTPETRLPYYRALWDRWWKSASEGGYEPPRPWGRIELAVRHEEANPLNF